jgi:hypothetical protein
MLKINQSLIGAAFFLVLMSLTIAGCVNNFSKNCDSFNGSMTQKQIDSCLCEEGQTKVIHWQSAGCYYDSQNICKTDADCKFPETCISKDAINWYCSEIKIGFLYINSSNVSQGVFYD